MYNRTMQTPEQLADELYDLTVTDCDRELNFYRELSRLGDARGQAILEVACGTGRVAIRLAAEGANEEVSEGGSVLQAWTRDPVSLHCVFRFEMEHLLVRTGFVISALYGDFFKHELTDTSSEMIWLARKPQRSGLDA